jgi:uncharacterized protein YcbK (DUF882 family)
MRSTETTTEANTQPNHHRRRFLRVLAAGAALVAGPALAGVRPSGERILSLYNLHTGERLKAPYWADGAYLPDALTEVNRVLRDHRTDEVHAMDPALLDLLHALHHTVDARGEFHVISGYRSPKSNAMLRSRSNGVAKRSFHMKGQAIDIRLPECELDRVHRAALALRAGGVGKYAGSGFVHVDTGPVRSW